MTTCYKIYKVIENSIVNCGKYVYSIELMKISYDLGKEFEDTILLSSYNMFDKLVPESVTFMKEQIEHECYHEGHNLLDVVAVNGRLICDGSAGTYILLQCGMEVDPFIMELLGTKCTCADSIIDEVDTDNMSFTEACAWSLSCGGNFENIKGGLPMSMDYNEELWETNAYNFEAKVEDKVDTLISKQYRKYRGSRELLTEKRCARHLEWMNLCALAGTQPLTERKLERLVELSAEFGIKALNLKSKIG